jgi:uncharacterized protein (TIGR00255 family)
MKNKSVKDGGEAPKSLGDTREHAGVKGATALLSMTGFGHSQRRVGGVLIEVEVKTVNHRFLEVSMKLPRVYSLFETELRKVVAGSISRGRVEVFVGRTVEVRNEGSVQFDQALLNHVYALEWESLQSHGLISQLPDDQLVILRTQLLRDLFRRGDIVSIAEKSACDSDEQRAVVSALEEALGLVGEMQAKEGQALAHDLNLRLSRLDSLKAQIELRASVAHATLRERLLERVRKLSAEVVLDENRLAAEVVLLADRSDITEELVRLSSHLVQFRESLMREPSGKRFDFLLQEIHREFNTIGSKAQDAELQKAMVEAKVEIEKLREQVQNVV